MNPEAEETPLPSQLDLIAAIAGLFGNRPVEVRHLNVIVKAADSILAEFRRERVDAKEKMGLAAWLGSDDTGVSSKYMAGILSGEFVSRCSPPWDPADFGRCYRMLRVSEELSMLAFEIEEAKTELIEV